MKSPDNVLLGLALFLFAGVILYNVFFVDADEKIAEDTASTNAVTTTISSNLVEDTSESTTAIVDTKININTASAEELETLTGIGPTKAKAIVLYRETNGSFASVNDLVNVSGIGEKTLAKIIDSITV